MVTLVPFYRVESVPVEGLWGKGFTGSLDRRFGSLRTVWLLVATNGLLIDVVFLKGHLSM